MSYTSIGRRVGPVVRPSVEVLEEAFRRTGRIRRPLSRLGGQLVRMSVVFAVVAAAVAISGANPLFAFMTAGPAMVCGRSALDHLPAEAHGHRIAAVAAFVLGIATLIGVSACAITVP